jgi:hypothetical protein
VKTCDSLRQLKINKGAYETKFSNRTSAQQPEILLTTVFTTTKAPERTVIHDTSTYDTMAFEYRERELFMLSHLSRRRLWSKLTDIADVERVDA